MLIHSSHSLRCISAFEVGGKGSIRAFPAFRPMPFRPIEPPWLAERREQCLSSLSRDAFLPNRERRNVVSFILCIPALHFGLRNGRQRLELSLLRLSANAFPPYGATSAGGKARSVPFEPFLRRLSLNSQAPECGIIHSSHSCATFRHAALRRSTHSAPPARGRAARPGRRASAQPSAGGRGSASSR